MHWFIDASNVIGSVPDGWWRDREGAARRLVEDVRAWAREDVTVVLESGPEDLIGRVTSSEVRACEDGGRNTVSVVRARRRGRDAADDEIVELVRGRDDARVVTSDARLAARVRALGADVEGARAFRRRLGSAR